MSLDVGGLDPKSRAGVRDVPLMAVLHDHLTAHKARTGRTSGLVFGRSETLPFAASTVETRAKRAWTAAKLEPIGLHECRHTFASLLIEAGVGAKRVSVWMGHHSTAFTLDRYAKLFERREAEEMQKVDAFFALANTAARVEQVERGPVVGQ